MKLIIREISEVTVKTGPRVRFSVTFPDEAGEPVITIRGFTMDAKRRVQTPAARTGLGHYYRFSEISDKWRDKLRDALNKMREVQDILGPEVEGVTYEGNQIIGGEIEVV